MLIAIHPDIGRSDDLSWPRWAESLNSAGHEVRWVDVYRADILEQLRGCHGFLWRHGHFGGMWHIARRLLPVIERELGLAVYPDQKTCWHYDDKIAQAHLLKAAGIPTPRTWVWFDGRAAREWASAAEYPLVLKLWSGACSANVRLVKLRSEADYWIDRLFSEGVYDLSMEAAGPPNILKRRVKAAARMLLLGRLSPPPRPVWDLHKNYVLFQEFLPNNPFDTRITVIGNRVFGFRRRNRANDFRASGSGQIEYDPEQVDSDSVRLGLRVAQRLQTQSLALDVLQRGEERLVSEVSYTFASRPVHDCPGHWELHGPPNSGTLVWRAGPMWPETAEIADFLVRLEHLTEGRRQ